MIDDRKGKEAQRARSYLGRHAINRETSTQWTRNLKTIYKLYMWLTRVGPPNGLLIMLERGHIFTAQHTRFGHAPIRT
jgi:hypothetical protein